MDQREADLLSGKTAFDKDAMVPMRSREGGGVIYNTPSDRVAYMLGRGYRLAEQDEVSAYDKAKELGTTGAVGMGLANFADTVLLGVPKTIAKNVLPQKVTDVMNEIEEQSIIPSIGTGAGIVGTMIEGPLSAPFSAVTKGAEAVASKTPLKSIVNGIRESQVGERIASYGLVEGATRFAGGVAKEAGKGIVRGAYMGTAYGLPSASIDALFGNTQEAGETLMYSAGIGAGLEGFMGGVLGGIKNIGHISDMVGSTKDKLMKKAFGSAGEFSEQEKEYAERILSEERSARDSNLTRLAKTAEELGVSPSNIPAEAVFLEPQKLEAAKIAEKTAVPFTGETPLQDQRILLENAAKKAIRERIMPEGQRFIDNAKKFEDVASGKIKGVYEEAANKYKALNEYQDGLMSEAQNIIDDPLKKINGLSERQIADRIEEGFHAKAMADILPARRLMEEADKYIKDVRINSKTNAINLDDLSPSEKQLIENEIRKMNIDPFEKDQFGRPNSDRIARARKIINNAGYDFNEGILTKLGDKVSLINPKIQAARDEAVDTLLNAYHSGKLSAEENRVIKDNYRILKNLENGKELTDQIKMLRSARDEKSGNVLVKKYNERKGHTFVINTMEDLSDKIKHINGGGEFAKIKRVGLDLHAAAAKKWKPIIQEITGRKDLTVKEIVNILDEGDFKEKMLDLTKKGFLKKQDFAKMFPEEFGLASAHEIKKLSEKFTNGGEINYKAFFNEVARWDSAKAHEVFGDNSTVLKRMSELLSDPAKTKSKAILEKILEKDYNPEDLAKALTKIKKSDLVEMFGDNAIKAKSMFEQMEKNKLLTNAFKTMQEASAGGKLDVDSFIKEIKKLAPDEQKRIFGSSGKKLANDLEHFFSHVKTATKASADDAISQLMSSGLTRELYNKSLSVVKLAAISAEKEAIIRGALNTEKEMQIKNISNAVLKRESVFEKLNKWSQEIVKDGTLKLRSLDLIGVESDKKSVKEEYESNVKIIQEMQSKSDFIINQTANKSNAFSHATGTYLQYMDVVNRMLQNMPMVPSTRKNNFFKMPTIVPTKLEMIRLNKKMEALKNPFSIVNDFSKGIVDKERMNIVATIYPKTFERIRTTIQNSILGGDIEASYQDRLKLSSFLGIDMDDSIKKGMVFQRPVQEEAVQNKPTNIKLKQGLASDVQSLNLA